MSPSAYPAVVEFDSYDRAVFDRALESFESLREAVASGTRLFAGFPSLAMDVFAALFKYNVVLRDAQPAEEGRTAVARRVVGWLMSARGLERLRAETVLDEDRAAFGCLNVLNHTLRLLTRHGAASAQTLGEEAEIGDLEQSVEALSEQLELAEQLAEGAEKGSASAAAASLRVERDAARKALGRLLAKQTRRLEGMPADIESDIRADIEALPQTMIEATQQAERFAREVGGGTPTGPEAMTLGEQLLTSKRLKQLAAMVGRFREAARGLRAKRVPRRSAEVHDVGLSGDLARMLPVETALLSHPVWRMEFKRRFAERRLLTYSLRDDDTQGRGPMIVCIDASGSMSGARDLWAKAVALSLMETARRQRRHFRAIVFSGNPKDLAIFDLLERPRSQTVVPHARLSKVAAFAECFPGGGTDFVAPLSAAMNLMQEQALSRGDIVLITDGQAHVPSTWLETFLAAKRRLDFRVISVLIEERGMTMRGAVEGFSDRVIGLSELTDDAAIKLATTV